MLQLDIAIHSYAEYNYSKKKKKHIEDINMGINTLESLKEKDMIESKRISIALWEINNLLSLIRLSLIQ